MTNIIKNVPALWRVALPVIKPDAHKYDRGVAVIYGAPRMTGATRLAAMACARVGAGLVCVIAPEGTGDIYRRTLPAHIIVEDGGGTIADTRCRSVLFGSGWTEEDGAEHLFAIQKAMTLNHIKGIVLDAGAFLAAKGLSSSKFIATPHEGEFAKAFPDLVGDKMDKAQEAAARVGGIIVLKGPQTIVAGTGDPIVQDRSLPQLATGGTGDVLAGMIAGFVAQGMDLRLASAAAVWIHGEAAAQFGVGLVASDLPDVIPSVLQDILT